MKSRGPLSLPLVISTHRTASKRICNAATALLAFTLCLAAAAPSAFGQEPCTQPPPVPAGAPLHTIIPVHFDPVTGSITVGSTTYCGLGQNLGFHLLALSRQPDPEHPDAPDVLLDKMFLN
ncbi:MAG: hypothetical protein JO138_17130, partial [Acidobacteriaceae bacterium]|nr:hypothetical protein [Acidobacteriaceae bacterium]